MPKRNNSEAEQALEDAQQICVLWNVIDRSQKEWSRPHKAGLWICHVDNIVTNIRIAFELSAFEG